MALRSTPLLMGYTGRCFIGDSEKIIQVFLTSYSLSINTNIIKSGAVDKIFISSSSSFNRIALGAVRDCPTYEISLSFQLTPAIFLYLQTQLCTNYFRKPLKVILQDQVYGFSSASSVENSFFYLQNCYVNSFSISVDNNAVAVASLGLSFFHQTFNLISNTYSNMQKQTWTKNLGNNVTIGGGKLLMPYYRWGVDYYKGSSASGKTYFNKDCLQNFSFSFSQQLTPKYGCIGSILSSSFAYNNAPPPSKIIFSVPTMNYELSYIYNGVSSYKLFSSSHNDYKDSSCGDRANQIVVDKSGYYGGWCLRVYYNFAGITQFNVEGDNSLKNEGGKTERNKPDKMRGFIFQSCYPDTYSPNFANSGSVNMLSVSGTIYGKIKTYSYGN